MDDELKIVLAAVLEADEQQSAARIAAQLPTIADLINRKSTIKVGISIDTRSISGQGAAISNAMRRAIQNPKATVQLDIDTNTLNRVRSELNSLGVDSATSRLMTDEIERLGISIEKIGSSYVNVFKQAEDTADALASDTDQLATNSDRLMTMTIQGTDALGRAVTYVRTYNFETQELEKANTSITANLKEQRQAQEKAAEAARKANEQRLQYLQKQQTALANLEAKYQGETSVKPLTDNSHIAKLNTEIQNVRNTIMSLQGAAGSLSDTQKTALEKQIADIDRLIRKYQNLEYVATSLRTKTVTQVRVEQGTDLDTLEQKLQSAGILTQEFSQKIADLRTGLANVADSAGITEYLNRLDQLKSQVQVFQTQLAAVDENYKRLATQQTALTKVKTQMLGLDATSEEYDVLNRKAQMYQASIDEITNAINEQYMAYANVVECSGQAAAYADTARLNELSMAQATAQLAQRAQEVDGSFGTMEQKIAATEARLRTLGNPTDELRTKVAELRGLFAQMQSADSDQQKVVAYEKLSRAISDCNTQMVQLARQDSMDLKTDTLEQKLQKARASLEAIGTKWSALRQDAGLNEQFVQLQNNLNRVRSTGDLSRWNTEFAAFKAQVQAAGKDVQSLGDTLRNNLSKVAQWTSATTLLFQALRAIRSGVETVVGLNTAMIDLRKTTDASEAEYAQFYKTANDTAKALGVTTQAVIEQTAEWSRLGYTLQEAATLAENSAIFTAVSPEMDLEQATDGIVSILKAFNLEVDDVLDGIISKINVVGNSFAVSNDDMVEALTRSSAAMAAANNSFEQTVALATAAVEITRDAEGAGNALRTIAMRIRGYSEETEELDDTLVNITGDIADLTKTASRPLGVSLFEEADPDTYKSTYDILKDIAEIWDELSDKNQAQLLEKLFGKQRAQVGAAILSNFTQAEAAVSEMATSAGSAMQEFETYTQSLQYKLTVLGETWTGVAQNLIADDTIALVVDLLQGLSNVVDGLTEHLGVLGTAGFGGLIAWGAKLYGQMKDVQTQLSGFSGLLGGKSFDLTSTAGVAELASALSTMSTAGQQAAMSMLGLDTQQKQNVVTMAAQLSACSGLTVAELAQRTGLDATALAAAANVQTTTTLTSSMVAAALASDALSAEQRELLTTYLSTATAAQTAGAATATLGASLKAAAAAMLATPAGWISLLVSVLPLAVTGVKKLCDALTVTSEEAYAAAEEHVQSLSDLNTNLDDLRTKLDETKARIAELQGYGVLSFVEQQELENLQTTNAELEIMIRQKERLAELEGRQADADLREAFSKASYSVSDDSMVSQLFRMYGDQITELDKRYGDLFERGRTNYAGLSETDRAAYDELSALYTRLERMQNTVVNAGELSGLDAEAYITELSTLYTGLTQKREEYAQSGKILSESEQEALEQAETALLQLSATISDDYLSLYTQDDETAAYWQSLLDSIAQTTDAAGFFAQKLQELPEAVRHGLSGAQGNLSAASVQKLAEQYPQLQQWMEKSGYTARDVADYYNTMSRAAEEAAKSTGSLTNAFETVSAGLADKLEEASSIGSILSEAAAEMQTDGQLSPDTVQEIMGVTENYVDLLYEENGAIHLNEQAMRELANASLEQDAQKLREYIAALEDQRSKLDALAQSAGRVDAQEAAQELASVNAQIENSNTLLAILQSCMDSVGGSASDNAARMEEMAQALSDITACTDNIQTEFSSYVSKIGEINQAIAEYNGKTVLTQEETVALINQFPGLISQLTRTENGYILNSNALTTLRTAEMNESQTMIAAEAEKARAILSSTNTITQKMTEQIASFTTAASYLSSYLNMAQSMGSLTKAQVRALNNLDLSRVNLETGQYQLSDGTMVAVNDTILEAASVAQNAIGYESSKNLASQLEELYGQIDWSGIGVGAVSSAGSGGGSSSRSTASSAAQDVRESMMSTLNDTLEAMDHQIFLWEKKGGMEEAIIQQYRNMQTYVHTLADQYRAMDTTAEESAEYIRKLQQDWWEYNDAIEQIRENLAQQEMDNFTAWLEDEKFGVSVLMQDGADTQDILTSWRSILDAINKEIEKYTENGYDISTDFLQELTQEAWSAQEEISSALEAMVSDASEKLTSVRGLYETLHDAADQYAASGSIDLDTLQKMAEYGVEYLAVLRDENGELVLNEDRIRSMVAAKAEQLAVESSLAYIEALKTAKLSGNNEELARLLDITQETTEATWSLVYANLAMVGLQDDEYDAALANINAMRSLAQSAIAGIGAVAEETEDSLQVLKEELETMQEGVNDILQYTMDMLKQKIQDQIDLLEEEKDAYSEIIALKKESLQASRDENNYQKSIASKIRQLAKLQTQIDMLSLDDSRSAQAEKVSLMEEMAELQEELAEKQADAALDATLESLDEMEDAYHAEKDKEIDMLEDSISSYQKLYDMAIDYIEDNWGTLYQELCDWNYEYGSSLTSEITAAWDAAQDAAERYGSYLGALENLSADISSVEEKISTSSGSTGSGTNRVVGKTITEGKRETTTSKTATSPASTTAAAKTVDTDELHKTIKEMYMNSVLWKTADSAGKKQLDSRNLYLGSLLKKFGINAVRGSDGVWYVGSVGGEQLFKKYRQYIYHKGGIVGGGTIRDDEQLALLQKGEWVLDRDTAKLIAEQMEDLRELNQQMENAKSWGLGSGVTETIGDFVPTQMQSVLAGSLRQALDSVSTSTDNSVVITYGDTIIHGAGEDTVRQHVEVSRDMVNQIARILKVKM